MHTIIRKMKNCIKIESSGGETEHDFTIAAGATCRYRKTH